MKVCVITDNLYIYEHFIDLLRRKPQDAEFDFYYATWNHAFREKFGENGGVCPITLRDQGDDFFNAYDLFVSLHCDAIAGDAARNAQTKGFKAFILREAESEEDKAIIELLKDASAKLDA